MRVPETVVVGASTSPWMMTWSSACREKEPSSAKVPVALVMMSGVTATTKTLPVVPTIEVVVPLALFKEEASYKPAMSAVGPSAGSI